MKTKEAPEIICEMCGEVCTDDFIVLDSPDSYNGYCLCPDCQQEVHERRIEYAQLRYEEMSESFM